MLKTGNNRCRFPDGKRLGKINCHHSHLTKATTLLAVLTSSPCIALASLLHLPFCPLLLSLPITFTGTTHWKILEKKNVLRKSCLSIAQNLYTATAVEAGKAASG